MYRLNRYPSCIDVETTKQFLISLAIVDFNAIQRNWILLSASWDLERATVS